MRAGSVIGICLAVFACRARLDGEYTDSAMGISSYTFKPNGKVVMSTFGIGMEMDYEVDGKDVKIKTAGGNMILKLQDDGSLGGPMGIKYSKKGASGGTSSKSEGEGGRFAGMWSCEATTLYTPTLPPGQPNHTAHATAIWKVTEESTSAFRSARVLLAGVFGRSASGSSPSESEISVAAQPKTGGKASSCRLRFSVSGPSASLLLPEKCEQNNKMTRYSNGTLALRGATMSGSVAATVESTSPGLIAAGTQATTFECSRR